MQSRLFRGLFKVMDRDGDGKVFEKEMIAYLDAMQDLQKRGRGRLRDARLPSPTRAAACSTCSTPTATAGSASGRCGGW